MRELVPNDEALLSAARSGDRAAFESLVRAHTRTVYAHALRFFGDPHAAEDVTQEVWIKVYRSLATFDDRARFSTWLYRVTRNACLDEVRSGKRRPVLADPPETVAAPGGDLADQVVLRASIEAAMAALPPDERDALSAIALFGLTYAEAAAVLGVPAGTVKSRVFRARRALTVWLGLSEGGD